MIKDNERRSYTSFASEYFPMRIPGDTPPGNYYLGLIIDEWNHCNESNEENNTHFVQIKVLKGSI